MNIQFFKEKMSFKISYVSQILPYLFLMNDVQEDPRNNNLIECGLMVVDCELHRTPLYGETAVLCYGVWMDAESMEVQYGDGSDSQHCVAGGYTYPHCWFVGGYFVLAVWLGLKSYRTHLHCIHTPKLRTLHSGYVEIA